LEELSRELGEEEAGEEVNLVVIHRHCCIIADLVALHSVQQTRITRGMSDRYYLSILVVCWAV
jgi:phage gp36-like protein